MLDVYTESAEALRKKNRYCSSFCTIYGTDILVLPSDAAGKSDYKSWYYPIAYGEKRRSTWCHVVTCDKISNDKHWDLCIFFSPQEHLSVPHAIVTNKLPVAVPSNLIGYQAEVCKVPTVNLSFAHYCQVLSHWKIKLSKSKSPGDWLYFTEKSDRKSCPWFIRCQTTALTMSAANLHGSLSHQKSQLPG